MILPVKMQLYYFLTAIIAGFCVGVMFDIYRIIRGFDNPRKLLTIISDLLFWILTAVLVFIFFVYSSNGLFRYNTFIGLLLGLFIYLKHISKYILKFLKWLIYYIIKFFRLLIILVFYPIKLIRYFFMAFIFNISLATRKCFKASKGYINKVKIGHNKKIKNKK